MYISTLDDELPYTNIGVVKTSIRPIILSADYKSTELGKKLSQMSFDLTANTLYNEIFIRRKKATPVLIIFEPIGLEKITDELVDSIAFDTVYFSSIDYDIDRHWVLGSVQSIIKLLRPAYKILDRKIFDTEEGHVTDGSAKYFQLVWLAHRIGLKVYEP